MRKMLQIVIVFLLLTACGIGRTFQMFFDNHKNDIGVTAVQVPDFMKALLRNVSPEINSFFRNVYDFKFITFTDISSQKQQELVKEMNLITANGYSDILRKNTRDKVKILSVVEEDSTIVKKAIIFNSTLAKTSVIYLKGYFDSNQIRELSETNQFEYLSNKLIQNYQMPNSVTPSFNPNK